MFQYLTHTALPSSAFTMSLNTHLMLYRSTTSSVACEHKNRSLVNTGIRRYPPAVSPWHGSLTIRWTLNCIAVRILHRYLLNVSLWDGSLAIHSLPHRGKTPMPSAVLPWEDSLSFHSLAIAVGQVPMGRMPVGKRPRYPLVACCIALLSLCHRKKTPHEENSMGRPSSCHGTLAYIVLSHLSNVQHSSRKHYLSLSLEHTIRLWWSSTLECSISFLHGNCPFNWRQRLQRLHTTWRCGFPLQYNWLSMVLHVRNTMFSCLIIL